MPKLFGVDLAGTIGKALGPLLLGLTLHKVTNAGRDPANILGGVQPTEVDFPGRGILSEYDSRFIDGQIVKTGDRKVLILGATVVGLQVPEPGDHVTIEGLKYNIVRVTRDPAAATYECQVRG